MTDCDLPDITRRQPHRILWALGLLHGELREQHGLSLHGYLILGALAEAASESLPHAQLTAFLGESGDRMSYLLRGLQAAGLIERDRCARDRRTVKVTLTDAGRARFADAERTAHMVVRRHLVPGLVTTVAATTCNTTHEQPGERP
jgi:DNA-binding MarR family transcriptional regulator